MEAVRSRSTSTSGQSFPAWRCLSDKDRKRAPGGKIRGQVEEEFSFLLFFFLLFSAMSAGSSCSLFMNNQNQMSLLGSRRLSDVCSYFLWQLGISWFLQTKMGVWGPDENPVAEFEGNNCKTFFFQCCILKRCIIWKKITVWYLPFNPWNPWNPWLH